MWVSRFQHGTHVLFPNIAYQLHAVVAWAFWALLPFSRLVHMFSIPLQYVGRPYILYRRRYPAAQEPPR